MANTAVTTCRINGCTRSVLPTLSSERLCLEHFLDQTLSRAQGALDQCKKNQPLDAGTLDWLFEDAQYTVQWLSRNIGERDPSQREKVLEVILCLANVNDYLRHHSVQLKPGH